MGRYKKFIFLIAALLLLIGIFAVFNRDKNKISINVKKNEVIIDNFEMAKIVDENNNYYKINARRAVMHRNDRTADLEDFHLEYKKGDTDFTAQSEHGTLVEEVRVDVRGKITGTLNELDFETGKKGTFHYDFDTEIGELAGNVVVNNEEGTILSDKAIIYHNENNVEFIGNVKVTYRNAAGNMRTSD